MSNTGLEIQRVRRSQHDIWVVFVSSAVAQIF
jgi:hypothetical protein